MYKKFFWALYTGLILCNLITTSQAGKYMEAFEHEVQNNRCRKLTCNLVYDPDYKSYPVNKVVSYVAGTSEGPLGLTTHYGYRSEPGYEAIKTDHYKCRRCGYDQGPSRGWLFYPTIPTVTFEKNGNTKKLVMDVREPYRADLPICSNPSFEFKDGLLQDIWEKAEYKFTRDSTASREVKVASWSSLQYLWSAAKQLDGEDGKSEEAPEDNKPSL